MSLFDTRGCVKTGKMAKKSLTMTTQVLVVHLIPPYPLPGDPTILLLNYITTRFYSSLTSNSFP